MELGGELALTGVDHRQALRGLGYGDREPDGGTLALLERCEGELLAAARPRWRCRVLDVLDRGAEGVRLEGGLTLPGADIARHLAGCGRAAVFCVTLSAGVDALLRRTQAEDMARAVVLDSCASAAVEQMCDLAEARIREAFPGCWFPYRYSPGYGDLPVTLQSPLLALLDAPRAIGLCAAQSQMLTPRKSVTAILGIAKGRVERGERDGCGRCFLNGRCTYQLRGKTCGT